MEPSTLRSEMAERGKWSEKGRALLMHAEFLDGNGCLKSGGSNGINSLLYFDIEVLDNFAARNLAPQLKQFGDDAEISSFDFLKTHLENRPVLVLRGLNLLYNPTAKTIILNSKEFYFGSSNDAERQALSNSNDNKQLEMDMLIFDGQTSSLFVFEIKRISFELTNKYLSQLQVRMDFLQIFCPGLKVYPVLFVHQLCQKGKEKRKCVHSALKYCIHEKNCGKFTLFTIVTLYDCENRKHNKQCNSKILEGIGDCKKKIEDVVNLLYEIGPCSNDNLSSNASKEAFYNSLYELAYVADQSNLRILCKAHAERQLYCERLFPQKLSKGKWDGSEQETNSVQKGIFWTKEQRECLASTSTNQLIVGTFGTGKTLVLLEKCLRICENRHRLLPIQPLENNSPFAVYFTAEGHAKMLQKYPNVKKYVDTEVLQVFEYPQIKLKLQASNLRAAHWFVDEFQFFLAEMFEQATKKSLPNDEPDAKKELVLIKDGTKQRINELEGKEFKTIMTELKTTLDAEVFDWLDSLFTSDSNNSQLRWVAVGPHVGSIVKENDPAIQYSCFVLKLVKNLDNVKIQELPMMLRCSPDIYKLWEPLVKFSDRLLPICTKNKCGHTQGSGGFDKFCPCPIKDAVEKIAASLKDCEECQNRLYAEKHFENRLYAESLKKCEKRQKRLIAASLKNCENCWKKLVDASSEGFEDCQKRLIAASSKACEKCKKNLIAASCKDCEHCQKRDTPLELRSLLLIYADKERSVPTKLKDKLNQHVDLKRLEEQHKLDVIDLQFDETDGSDRRGWPVDVHSLEWFSVFIVIPHKTGGSFSYCKLFSRDFDYSVEKEPHEREAIASLASVLRGAVSKVQVFCIEEVPVSEADNVLNQPMASASDTSC